MGMMIRMIRNIVVNNDGLIVVINCDYFGNSFQPTCSRGTPDLGYSHLRKPATGGLPVKIENLLGTPQV